MKRISNELLEALDRLIGKYSQEMWLMDSFSCPLCSLYWYSDCKECPNKFFRDKYTIVPCSSRAKNYQKLDYEKFENASTLKQFWADYKSLYLERKYTNSEIMEILIKNYEHTTTNN